MTEIYAVHVDNNESYDMAQDWYDSFWETIEDANKRAIEVIAEEKISRPYFNRLTTSVVTITLNTVIK